MYNRYIWELYSYKIKIELCQSVSYKKLAHTGVKKYIYLHILYTPKRILKLSSFIYKVLYLHVQHNIQIKTKIYFMNLNIASIQLFYNINYLLNLNSYLIIYNYGLIFLQTTWNLWFHGMLLQTLATLSLKLSWLFLIFWFLILNT